MTENDSDKKQLWLVPIVVAVVGAVSAITVEWVKKSPSGTPSPEPSPSPVDPSPEKAVSVSKSKIFKIMDSSSGKCIDVAGAPGRNNGARLQLWDCELSGTNPDNNSITDQRWTLTDDRHIRNELSGKCIDVVGAPGRSDGARLQLWDCELSGTNPDNNSITDQRWTLTDDRHIRNELSGKCINVADAFGRSNGAGLQLGDCERPGTWTFESLD
jgi:hypothetical protein